MSLEIFYFDINYAQKTHDWIIETSGGLHGVYDLGLLQSPLEHIQNDDYYPTFEDKLLHLIFSINKNHVFVDGNKRSSLVLGAYFLKINGYDYCIENYMYEMENIIVWVAEGKIDKELLREILVEIIGYDDFSEELKLKIYNAIIS